MIHVYYGDGKGKTTAALGLVLRAAGCGIPCAVVQFLKDWHCGELETLEKLGITVWRGKSGESAFAKDMTGSALAETKRVHDENLTRAVAAMRSGAVRTLVLDEAMDALSMNLLDADTLLDLLANPPEQTEIVVTGHVPDPRVLRFADYVTEMVKRAHPYDRGITARKGVEF